MHKHLILILVHIQLTAVTLEVGGHLNIVHIFVAGVRPDHVHGESIADAESLVAQDALRVGETFGGQELTGYEGAGCKEE